MKRCPKLLSSDYFSDDLCDRRKSPNMTECVPVPTSEHVAEIVGRQGYFEHFTYRQNLLFSLLLLKVRNRTFTIIA